MHYFDSTIIEGAVYLHQVGNKLNNDPLVLTNTPLAISTEIQSNLKQFFLSHFKQMEYYSFYHEASLSMNEVYNYVTAIFEDISSIGQQSKYLAQTLYRRSGYPNIKGGEFYIVHFKNCLIDGDMVDAVGLFKSENKDSFIKVLHNGNTFELIQELGININKLDKGCLIFNTHREDGYVVSVVDKSNRGEAKYWVDDFLQLKRNNDSYTQTQNMVSMCKNFISQLSPKVDKVEKAVMMNRVMEELKEGTVSINKVATSAFGDKVGFDSFRKDYQESHGISFDDTFQSKPESIKRRAIGTMTTIKLDNNFDLHIHGGEKFIERGYDSEKGMIYYKLYFKEEK